jgi:hypothetical protein
MADKVREINGMHLIEEFQTLFGWNNDGEYVETWEDP